MQGYYSEGYYQLLSNAHLVILEGYDFVDYMEGY